MSTPNVQPDQQALTIIATVWFDHANLPDGWLADSGRILIDGDSMPIALGFADLDTLDAVIGRLTQVRYAIATEQRDRDRKAKAAQHYPNLLAQAQATDEVAV